MRVLVTVRTAAEDSMTGRSLEIPDREWEGMNEKQRNEYLLETVLEMIEWSYDEV